jgi:hypothetical protein
MNLTQAIALAANVHAGETDKGGQPYILHPLRVMLALGLDATETERCAAVLHDVIEALNARDARDEPKPWSQRIRALDILVNVSEELHDALISLTRVPSETYRDYIDRLAPNAIARKVKLEDLRDNLDPARRAMANRVMPLGGLTERYQQAMKVLLEHERRTT